MSYHPSIHIPTIHYHYPNKLESPHFCSMKSINWLWVSVKASVYYGTKKGVLAAGASKTHTPEILSEEGI